MLGKYSGASRGTAALLIATIGIALTATAQVPVDVPAPSPAALAYESVSNRFWVADHLVAPLLAGLLLFSGLGNRLCGVVSRWVGGRRYLTIMLFAAGLVLLTELTRAPLNYFWIRAHDLASGGPATEFGDWLTDQVQDALLTVVGGGVVAIVLYWLIARSPRKWWLHAAIPAAGIVLFVLFAQPLMQTYEPMDGSAVAQKIAALAQRAGVPSDRIGVQHSDDSTGCGAATVIGLGPSRRMLLDDTLVANYSEGEILESVAHESKHFTHDDNVEAFLLISAWLLFAFWLVNWGGRWAAFRWQSRFGFADLADPASVPLIVLIFVASFWAALPFGRAFQQTIVEQAADRFALDLTHDNQSEASLYIKDLHCYPLMLPSPGVFYQTFRATHPSIKQRISFANSYHPWRTETSKAGSD